jgi:hypothetical protein
VLDVAVDDVGPDCTSAHSRWRNVSDAFATAFLTASWMLSVELPTTSTTL